MPYLLFLFIFASFPSYIIAYTIHTFSDDFESIYASSINDQGYVAGKIKVEGLFYDFIWSEENGISYFPFESKDTFPCLNNHQEILGVITTEKSIWNNSPSSINKFYYYNPLACFVDADPFSETNFHNSSLVVLSGNDKGQFLVKINEREFAIWVPDNAYLRDGHFEFLDSYEKDFYYINNQGKILCKMGSYISLYDVDKKTTLPLFEDDNYTITAFNDRNEICGWNSIQMCGFLWSPQMGFSSLGNFYPIDLNNEAQMVGDLIKNPKNYPLDLSNLIQFAQDNPAIWLDDRAIPIKEFVPTSSEILNLCRISNTGNIIGHILQKEKIQAVMIKK